MAQVILIILNKQVIPKYVTNDPTVAKSVLKALNKQIIPKYVINGLTATQLI